MIPQIWNIVTEAGTTAITFTSFLAFSSSQEGQVVSYPVERGSFATYNKVQSPGSFTVSLGQQGDAIELQTTLTELQALKDNPTLVHIICPERQYGPVSLESFNYSRTLDSGAGMLIVELTFIEVLEVETQVSVTISGPRNPTSVGNVNTGKTGPDESKSLAQTIGDWIRGQS